MRKVLQGAGLKSKDTLESLRLDLSKITGLDGLSSGDRKQFFAEYQTQTAKREREESRLAKQRGREEFSQLLEHWAEDGELDPNISFRQIATVCSKMLFWSIVALEELDDIFQDFIASYESRSKHLIKERRHEKMRGVFRMLGEKWDSSVILPSWEDARSLMDQYPSFCCSMDELDRIEVFEDYINEKVEKKKEERRRSERREGRRKRDAFIDLLENHRSLIAPENGDPIRWDEFQSVIKEEIAYVELIGTRNSSQPYDLFSEYRDTWNREAPKRSNSSSSRSSDRKRPRTMYPPPIGQPPPPPPHPMNWVPPPPPAVSHDPLELPVDWFIDVPSGSLHEVLRLTGDFDKRFGTSTTHVAGGPGVSMWVRLRIHGKPVGIHHAMAEVLKVSKGVEAGFSPDVPFPVGGQGADSLDANAMPVYHAAWVEYKLSNRTKL